MNMTRGCVLFGVLLVLSVFLIKGCSGQCHVYDKPLHLIAKWYTKVYHLPSHYTQERYMDCEWTIMGDAWTALKLEVQTTADQQTMFCFSSLFNVYDGPSSSYPRLMATCGTTSMVYFSSGPYLHVVLNYNYALTMSYTMVRPPTTSNPFWFGRPTRATTTTTHNPWEDGYSINVPAVMGGMVVGLAILFVCLCLCRLCYNRTQQQSPSRRNMANPPQFSSGNGQGSVFTLSGRNMASSSNYGGATNAGFSSLSDAPPSYDSLEFSSTSAQPVAPPSYNDVISMSNCPNSPKPE